MYDLTSPGAGLAQRVFSKIYDVYEATSSHSCIPLSQGLAQAMEGSEG